MNFCLFPEELTISLKTGWVTVSLSLKVSHLGVSQAAILHNGRELTQPPKAMTVFNPEFIVLMLVKSSNKDTGRSSIGVTRKSPGVI